MSLLIPYTCCRNTHTAAKIHIKSSNLNVFVGKGIRLITLLWFVINSSLNMVLDESYYHVTLSHFGESWKY